MCKLNEKSTGSVLLFCILGQWLRPHFRPDCLYESRDSWQYKFSSVIAILRGKRPCFRLACVTQPRCFLSFLMYDGMRHVFVTLVTDIKASL